MFVRHARGRRLHPPPADCRQSWPGYAARVCSTKSATSLREGLHEPVRTTPLQQPQARFADTDIEPAVRPLGDVFGGQGVDVAMVDRTAHHVGVPPKTSQGSRLRHVTRPAGPRVQANNHTTVARFSTEPSTVVDMSDHGVPAADTFSCRPSHNPSQRPGYKRDFPEHGEDRPSAHAAEAGISRQYPSKWVSRSRVGDEAGLLDRLASCTINLQPSDPPLVAGIQRWRRERKWPARRSPASTPPMVAVCLRRPSAGSWRAHGYSSDHAESVDRGAHALPAQSTIARREADAPCGCRIPRQLQCPDGVKLSCKIRAFQQLR